LTGIDDYGGEDRGDFWDVVGHLGNIFENEIPFPENLPSRINLMHLFQAFSSLNWNNADSVSHRFTIHYSLFFYLFINLLHLFPIHRFGGVDIHVFWGLK
jgi:hypothetical protein